jgi:hypothetical protein
MTSSQAEMKANGEFTINGKPPMIEIVEEFEY